MNNTPGFSKRPFDPIVMVIKRLKHIFLCVIILLVIFLPAAWLKQKPYYEATGNLRIKPVQPAFLKDSADLSITGYYLDYIRTEQLRLELPSLLEKAISKIPNHERSSIGLSGNINEAANRAAARLNIRHIPRTQLLEINMINDKKESLHTFVNHIMQTYLERLDEEESDRDKRRIEYLSEVKKRITKQRKELKEKLMNFAEEMKTGTFVQGYWVGRESLAEIQKSLSRSESIRIEAAAQLETAQKEKLNMTNLDLNPRIEDRLSKDSSLWNTEFWTYRQMQNMRSSVDGITSNNPDRIYIDQRLTSMGNYMEGIRSRAKDRAQYIEIELNRLKYKEREIQAELNLQEKLRIEANLKIATEKMESKAGESAKQLVAAREMQKELEHLSHLKFRLDERIHELSLDSKAPRRAFIEKLAEEPTDASGNNLKKLLAMAGAISFGLSILTFLFIDFRDQKIKNPEHVEMATGQTVAWPISHYSDKDLEFKDIILNSPTHVSSRAIRSLAFKVSKKRKENEPLIVTCTGVHAQSGISNLVINLARAMKSTGAKVLIADINQECHVNNLINDTKDINNLKNDDLYIKDKESNIDIYWRSPIHSKELHISEVIKNYKNEYDIIIIDSPPVLTSDVTESVLSISDIALLVSHGNVTNYSSLRRSFEIIWQLDLKHVFPVLNWYKKA